MRKYSGQSMGGLPKTFAAKEESMIRALSVLCGLITWGVAMHDAIADETDVRVAAPISACSHSTTNGSEIASPPNVSNDDLVVARTLTKIESVKQVQKGLQTLEGLARKGSSTAMYRLGMLYMMGIGVQQDEARALRYLGQVRGDFRIAATTLSGVIYARGSAQAPPNRTEAERMFRDAEQCLLQVLHTYGAVPATDADMVSRMRWHESSGLLYGYARNLGITLKGSRGNE